MNLLNLIQSQLSPQAIGELSNTVGENPGNTQSAMNTISPALLGSLANKASTPVGANEVFNMLKQGQSQGGWMDSISGLVSKFSSGGLQSSSQSLLGSLLGSKLGAVTDFIASHCGIRSGSATSLISMAAPFMMGLIGKQAASQGLNASGLGQLLGSQTQFLKDAMPSGLANTLGLGNLFSSSRDTAKIETTAGSSPPFRPAERETTYQSTYQREAYTRPEDANAPRAQGGGIKWAWLPVLLLLGLGGWLLLNRGQRNVGGSEDYNPPQTGRATKTMDWSSLKLTPGGFADNLAKALSSGDYGQVIDFHGVSFDATGKVAESSATKLRELSSVLQAAPNVKITIIGYGATENDGLAKADAIKSTLGTMGISGERIATRAEVGTGVPSMKIWR